MNRPQMKTKEAMLLMFKNILRKLNATDSFSSFSAQLLFSKALPCHLWLVVLASNVTCTSPISATCAVNLIHLNCIMLIISDGLENREYGRGDPLRWPCDTLYPLKLALTSPTSGGRSVGIDPLRTKATEFFLIISGKPPRILFINFFT
jgi:hypothetical protein